MNEVALITCIESVAEKWIEDAVKYGGSREDYSYHDDVLWKKIKSTEEPKQITVDDLALF